MPHGALIGMVFVDMLSGCLIYMQVAPNGKEVLNNVSLGMYLVRHLLGYGAGDGNFDLVKIGWGSAIVIMVVGKVAASISTVAMEHLLPRHHTCQCLSAILWRQTEQPSHTEANTAEAAL